MLVQLPNGKTVEMSFEEWDKMTDDNLQYFLATNQGEEINDPFFGSVLKKPSTQELEEEILEDLTEIPDDVKLIDDDFTTDE